MSAKGIHGEELLKGRGEAVPLFDNANRLMRVMSRLRSYAQLVGLMVSRGVPISEIVQSEFPRLRTRPPRPLMLTVELTNWCNLRCVYCTSPLGLRPRGFMSAEVFDRVLDGISRLKVQRVRVVGNGEPTLHSEFAQFLPKLVQRTAYVSVLSNGQWARPKEIINALLGSGVALIEFSVDSSHKEGYEASRTGASFNRLVENLSLLRQERERAKVRPLTCARLMMRPSERDERAKLVRFWRQYVDTVMVSRVVERRFLDYSTDVYKPAQFVDATFPKCSMPFKTLDINWNGDVPLCSYSAQQVGAPGIVIGNVLKRELDDLWQDSIIEQYREGHCHRDESKMPICKGCVGA